MKYYTIGELFKLKLLKNHLGNPYTSKAAVSKIINSTEYRELKTAWGMAKVITDEQLKEINNRWE